MMVVGHCWVFVRGLVSMEFVFEKAVMMFLNFTDFLLNGLTCLSDVYTTVQLFPERFLAVLPLIFPKNLARSTFKSVSN